MKTNSLLKAALGCIGTVALLAACDPAVNEEQEVRQLKKDNAKIVAQIEEMQKSVDQVEALRKQASDLTDQLRDLSTRVSEASSFEKNTVFGDGLVKAVQSCPIGEDMASNRAAMEKIGKEYAKRLEELSALESARDARLKELQDRRLQFLSNDEYKQLKTPSAF